MSPTVGSKSRSRKVEGSARTTGGDMPASMRALVPDAEVAEMYVSRYLEDVLDLDMMAWCHSQSPAWNVLIEGPTGPGKTTFLRAYCARNDVPFVNVPCADDIDVATMLGGPNVDVRTGGLRWIWGPVAMAVMYGGMLYFDEVNALRGRIATAVHGLLDGRRVLTLTSHPFTHLNPETGEYVTLADGDPNADVWPEVTGPAYLKAHPKLIITGAYNPEYRDMKPMNEAFANRFAMRIVFDYDEQVEAALLPQWKALRQLAVSLREAGREGVIRTPISTNMLIEFAKVCDDTNLSFSFARMLFLNHFPPEERPAVEIKFDTLADRLMEEFGWEPVDA